VHLSHFLTGGAARPGIAFGRLTFGTTLSLQDESSEYKNPWNDQILS